MIPVVSSRAAGVPGKPRASGDDPDYGPDLPDEARVNPARAGMIRIGASARRRRPSKPRASGDDPIAYDPQIGRPL